MKKLILTVLLISGILPIFSAAAQESGTFKGPGVYFGKTWVEIVPDGAYRLSGEFRATEGPAPAIMLGAVLYDEKKQLIAHPFVADIPGTLTELAEPAAAGDREVKIKDASKWKKSFAHYVKIAFNAKADFSDLPNRDISPFYIDKVVKDGNCWRVKLRGPLAKAYPAGTPVRQHQEGGFLNFVLNMETGLTDEWRKFSGVIRGFSEHGAPMNKFWKGTRFARIALSVRKTKTPVEFRNLTLVKDDSIGKPPKAELAVRFDFSKSAAGKKKIKATEGKADLYSQTGTFVLEAQALRLAPGAKLYLKHCDLPDLTKNFSFNLWVTLNRIQTEDILLDKSLSAGRRQFRFRLSNGLPSFTYRRKGRLRGIRTLGLAHNASSTYSPESRACIQVKDQSRLIVRPGIRTMLTCVFSNGDISIYRDGELILKKSDGPLEQIDSTTNDLGVGCEFRKGDFRAQLGSDLRMEHLRIYSGCLDPQEIKELYQQEKNAPPQWTAQLTDCLTYRKALLPDCDQEFEKTLPRTAAYLKNLPDPAKVRIPPGSTSRVYNRDNVMHFEINGKEYFPIMAQGCCSGAFRAPLHDPKERFDRVMADPAAAGLEYLGVMPNAWIDYPFIWKDHLKYDFKLIDLAVKKVLSVAPGAKIQFVIFPDLLNWFIKKHNEEMPRYHIQWTSSSEVKICYTGPIASPFWLESSGDLIVNIIRFLEKQPYAGHIVDYKLFMSGGGEWHWPGCFTGGVGGYSKPAENGFRNYLKKKYRTDDALRKAWKKSDVSLENVKVPSPEERLAGSWGYFIDFEVGIPSRDFREYMCDCILSAIKFYTRAMKDASGWKKTVTIYQGYSFYFYRSGNPLQLQSGFDIFRHVLELNSIDHIGTPISYENRSIGNIGPNNNPFNGSAALHDKLMWQENDLRTHLRPTPEYGSSTTAEETRELLRRGFGMSLTTGTGFWYYPGYQWHDTMTMDTIAELKRIGDLSLQTDRRSAAEVALIFDEASMPYSSGALRSQFIDDHCWFLYNKMFLTGAPFDCFLASDLGHPKMKDYKLYIMMNSFFADRKMREMIARKVRKNNAVVLWNYAPGLFSEKGRSRKNMFDLTGIRLNFENKCITGSLKVTDPKHPITAEAKRQLSYPVQPMVWVDDPEALILGQVAGRNALAVKKMKNWTSVYSVMPFTQEMLDGLCDFAGVHRYLSSGDVLTANRGFVALHTASAGDKTIALPGKYDVRELYSGKIMGKNISRFTDAGLRRGVSRLYQITPAK